MKNRRLLIRILGAAPLLALPALASMPLPRRKPSGADDLPLLVLDAGHGGRDPGAIGTKGTYEKNVTLDLVTEIAGQMSGKARVKLTRENDRFLALPERVAFAREAGANLFLSLHADSAPDSSARGLSAYVLSDTASDDFAGKLAEGENIVDERYGADVAVNAAVADILYDLAARQTIIASRFARESLVSGVGSDMRLLEAPKRSANFAVLRAPDMPSLLVETGFLSNSADEDILASTRERKRIASVLARELGEILQNPLFS